MKRFLKRAIAMWLIVSLLLGAIPEAFASSAAGAIEALAEEAQAHPVAEDSALAANAKEQGEATDGDGWIYRIDADGYAELIGYADAAATALTLPEELGGAWVVRLAEDAFAENEALRSVTIPAQIGEIPDSAFPNQQHMTVHALNGTAALAFAAKRGFSQRNESEYDFFDDILDLSEMEPSQWSLSGNSVELSAPYSLLVREGQRVYLPEREEYTHGRPVQLSACGESDGGVRAVCTDLNFVEAVRSYREENTRMEIDWEHIVILSDDVTLETPPRSRSVYQLPTFYKEMSFNVKIKLGNVLSVTGEAKYTPKIDISVDYSNFKVHKFTYEDTTTTSFNLKVETKNKLDESKSKQSLAMVPLVGTGIISLWLELSFEVSTTGSVTLNSEVVSHEKYIKSGDNTTYTKSVRNKHCYMSAAVKLTMQLKGALSVRIGFIISKVKVDAKVGELALAIGLTVQAKSSTESPDCMDAEIYGFLKLEAAIGLIEADVILEVPLELVAKIPIFELREMLLKLHFEYENGEMRIVEKCTKSKFVTAEFYIGDPDALIDITEVTVERGSTLTKPKDPVRPGYTFKGWFKEPEFENEWNFDSDTADTDVILYAKWERNGPNEQFSTPTIQPGGTTPTLPGGVTPTPAPTPTPSPTPPRLLTAEESLPYLKYEIGDDGVTITGYNDKPVMITVPDKIEGKTVIAIGEEAFNKCSSLLRIELPDCITSIGGNAFYSCENLSRISLPENLASIGPSAFGYCSALTKIVLPDSITNMGVYAFTGTSLTSVRTPRNWSAPNTDTHISPFYGCKTLKHVEVPEGATVLPAYAFYETSIESVSLPSTLNAINARAFYLCKSLEQISLPENLKEIGDYAFGYCSSLKRISLPGELTTLGVSAFFSSGLEFVRTPKWIEANCPELVNAFLDCDSLRNIEVPEGATVIPRAAFWSTNITSVSLPSTLKTIMYSAFRNCSSLEQISLPENLETIGEEAFENCSSLTRISFPKNLKTIVSYAFQGCSSLTQISFSENLESIGSGVFADCVSLKQVSLPDGLKSLGYEVFGDSGLEYVRTPKWVEADYSIGEGAFKSCNSLQRVEVPEGATIIPACVFKNTSIVSVSLPSTLKIIQEEAFAHCASLKQISLPDGLTTLEKDAFANSGLEYVRTPKWVEADYSIPYQSFHSCAFLRTVEVPEGATFMPNAFSWSSITSVSLPSTLKTIAPNAFSSCYSLTQISIPDGVTKIGEHAFSYSGLTSIRMPKSWTDYEETVSLFKGCKQLKSVVVPEGVTQLPDSAFEDASGIESVQLPTTLKSIGNYTFRGCSALKRIELPDGITTIGSHAFENAGLTSVRMPASWGNPELNKDNCAFTGCENLKYVEVPEGVTVLPYRAFYRTALENISLPSTLREIGDGALTGCRIQTLTIPAGVTHIAFSAFVECKFDSVVFLGDIELENDKDDMFNTIFYRAKVGRLLIPANAEKLRSYARKRWPNIEQETLPSSINTLYWSNTGDGVIAPSLVQAGRKIARPADPVWEGRRFTGWYRDAACSQPWDFANDVMPSESMTLYAGWDDSVGFIYDKYSSSCTITGYQGSATSLTIPSELNGVPVTTLGAESIPDSVMRLTIPASITYIYSDALRYASGLTSIEVAAGNTHYQSRDGVLFEGNKLFAYPQSRADERYAIPEGTAEIGAYAFHNCEFLRALEVPSSVKSLRMDSIYDCDRLNSVSFEADVDSISTNTFQLCGSNLNVTGPLDATKLIEYADRYYVDYNIHRLILVQDGTVLAALRARAGTPLGELPAPEVAEAGMAFLGWSTAEDGSEIWSGDGAVMPAEDVVLYSVERYPFEYEATGGGVRLTRYIGADGEVRIPERIEGSAVVEIAPGCFEGKRVTLVGDKGGLAERFAQAQGLNFEALRYELRFETNGGRSIAPRSLCATDALDLPTPLRTGYAFQAWCADAALTQRWTETAMPNRDLTLYALWTPTSDDAPDVPFTFEEEDGGVVITGYTGASGRAVVPATINELPVTAIGAYAFQDNQFLQEVELPASVKRVGEGAFAGSSLYSVAMPGVETIDASAFCGCDQLANVNFGAGLRSVGAFAFEDCSALLKLTLPSGLTELGEGAFLGCTWLTRLQLPDALETIGVDAFSGCRHLTAIRLGANVSEVGSGAFDGCTALAAIEVDAGNAIFFSTEGVLYKVRGSYDCDLVRYPEGKTDESYTTPEELREILPGAMQGARFRRLKMPEVSEIGEYALQNCINLENMDIKAYSLSIKKGALHGCANLREVRLNIWGAGEPPVDESEPYGSAIFFNRDIFPPQRSLLIISDYDYVIAYAKKCGIRAVRSNGVPVTGISIMDEFEMELGEEEALIPELLPSGTTETNIDWSSEDASIAAVNANGLVIARGAGETTITATAENGASASCLVRVTRKPVLAESIALSPEALKLRVGDMRSVAAIVLPTGAEDAAVTWSVEDSSIADWFSGCVIGKSIGQTTLTATTAGGLSASCAITVVENMEIIPMDAPDFLLPDSLTALEAEAFKGLPMTVVRCPSGLREIGSRAFANCEKLRQIYIPPSATSIAEDAFEGCGAGLVIYGEYGTAAETYAEAHGYSFREMG